MSKELLPLAVDLDGTLIFTDVTYETLKVYLTRQPWKFFLPLLWWMKGRAYIKKRLAQEVTLDPRRLIYNKSLISYLKKEKQQGRVLILATAADEPCAQLVADHLGLFDQVIASDGITNLRSQAKAQKLVQMFGEKQFLYAGNSASDLAVWAVSYKGLAVNTPRRVLKRCGKNVELFVNN